MPGVIGRAASCHRGGIVAASLWWGIGAVRPSGKSGAPRAWVSGRAQDRRRSRPGRKSGSEERFSPIRCGRADAMGRPGAAGADCGPDTRGGGAGPDADPAESGAVMLTLWGPQVQPGLTPGRTSIQPNPALALMVRTGGSRKTGADCGPDDKGRGAAPDTAPAKSGVKGRGRRTGAVRGPEPTGYVQPHAMERDAPRRGRPPQHGPPRGRGGLCRKPARTRRRGRTPQAKPLPRDAGAGVSFRHRQGVIRRRGR